MAPLPVLCVTKLEADRDQTSLTSRTNAQFGRGMPSVVLIPKPVVQTKGKACTMGNHCGLKGFQTDAIFMG